MNQHPWSGFPGAALSAAVAIVAMVGAAPALAQNTTAAIGGSVVDVEGRPVAGATVLILHTESKTVSSTTTDGSGRYAARGLRVGGPYTITISKDGRSDQREGVILALAEILNFDATLGLATATVVVTGQAQSQVFNRSNMGAGTSLSGAELNALASIQRNLQDYARTDPRLAQTDKERGRISAGGQNFRFNSVTIDGVTTNDTFGLEDNNLPTLKQPISIDAIQSAQVNLSNFDVTQKGYTGANINAVTKSGTNEVRGSLYHVYRSDDMAGQRINDTTGVYFDPPKFKETTQGFTLGGPIIKDKLFFFANYEELISSRSVPDFGPIGDSRTNVLISPTALADAATVAKNTYGLAVGDYSVPSGAQLSVKDSLLKLDWTINDEHRASLRYNKTEQSEPQFPAINATALSLSSHWYPQAKTIESVVGQWFADWTSSFSTELKLSKRDYDSVPKVQIDMPQVALNYTGLSPTGSGTRNTTLFFGTERSRHFNALRTQTQDAYFAGNWALGAHAIKAGLDISRNQIFNAFVQDTKGNYIFRCLNSSAALTYSFGAINCATATPAQVDAAVLENFQRGRPAQYTLNSASTGHSVSEAAAQWALTNTGLFLQDDWAVNKQLALTLGLRLDQSSSDDKPLVNAEAAKPVVAASVTGLGTGTRQTGGFGIDNTKTLDGNTLLQPRLGFNYALDAKDRRAGQIRGGLGLFQGESASVWLSNPYSNTGVVLRTVGCGSGTLGACPASNGTFNADPALQPTTGLGSATPQAAVDFLAPGVRQPAVWKLNLAFDRELPWFGLQAGAEWIHTRTDSAIYYKQLNLGGVTGTGPDGRPMYFNASGYNPACWTASGLPATGVGCTTAVSTRALSNSLYSNVLQVTDTRKGSGNQFTLSLRQQPWAGLNWQAAYTRTAATEVSPLTSSTAGSNFGNRAIFDPNEEVAANSAYLIRDRVSAAVTWSRAFVDDYKTTVGLFYEGRKGLPYSWTYFNDINGDGFDGNDLMYIPKGPGSGEVIFKGGAAEEAKFWEIVAANPELDSARGTVVKRASSYNPFVNTFDLRISQQVPGFTAKHKGVFTIDLLNVGNMIDKKWGQTREIGFNQDRFGGTAGGGISRSFVNYSGMQDGKYVYSLGNLELPGTKQVKGESQWAVQVTLRYEF